MTDAERKQRDRLIGLVTGLGRPDGRLSWAGLLAELRRDVERYGAAYLLVGEGTPYYCSRLDPSRILFSPHLAGGSYHYLDCCGPEAMRWLSFSERAVIRCGRWLLPLAPGAVAALLPPHCGALSRGRRR